MKQPYISPQVKHVFSATLMTEGHVTLISNVPVTDPAQGRHFDTTWDFMPGEAADEGFLE